MEVLSGDHWIGRFYEQSYVFRAWQVDVKW